MKFQTKLFESLKFLDGGSPLKDPLMNIVISVFAAKETIIGQTFEIETEILKSRIIADVFRK